MAVASLSKTASSVISDNLRTVLTMVFICFLAPRQAEFRPFRLRSGVGTAESRASLTIESKGLSVHVRKNCHQAKMATLLFTKLADNHIRIFCYVLQVQFTSI
jgi:hypothetical protein